MFEWFLAPTGGLWKTPWHRFYMKTFCTMQMILSMDICIREGSQKIYSISCSSGFWPLLGALKKNDFDFIQRQLALVSWFLAWICILERVLRKCIIFHASLILAPIGWDCKKKTTQGFFSQTGARHLIFSMDIHTGICFSNVWPLMGLWNKL